MPWINTANLKDRNNPDDEISNQIYNGLDCCVTLEVWHKLRAELLLRTNCLKTFQFRMEIMAPLIEMAMRGIHVNFEKRQEAITYLETLYNRLQKQIDMFAAAVWDRGLNPNSPKQLQEFFYGTMRVPEVKQSFKGVRRVTTNREALEKISIYLYPRVFCTHIIAIRDVKKLIGVLRSGIDKDNRMRTSYNAGGTDTGRLSSNKNVFGGGTNLQNITQRLRQVFEADKGWKLALPDLEQAESRAVGGIMIRLFQDYAYHNACNSGDLHTNVAKMVWRDKLWPSDPKEARSVADQYFYRDMSFRDMSKRGGHATNYYGKPFTVARNLKVLVPMIESFQKEYLGAFHLDKWHKWVSQQLMTTQMMITALGMERVFFDRPDTDETLRKAIAFEPQSIVGQVMNMGMLRIWRHMPEVKLVLQVHDAVGFLYRDNPVTEPAILAKAQELLKIPLQFGKETIVIPSEMKVGWNWGSFDPKKPDDNPDGLIKWKGKDARRRTEGRLDKLLSSLYLPNTKS